MRRPERLVLARGDNANAAEQEAYERISNEVSETLSGSEGKSAERRQEATRRESDERHDARSSTGTTQAASGSVQPDASSAAPSKDSVLS